MSAPKTFCGLLAKLNRAARENNDHDAAAAASVIATAAASHVSVVHGGGLRRTRHVIVRHVDNNNADVADDEAARLEPPPPSPPPMPLWPHVDESSASLFSAAPDFGSQVSLTCDGTTATTNCRDADNSQDEASRQSASTCSTQPARLTQTDDDWDVQFSSVLEQCCCTDTVDAAMVVNQFCSNVPYTTWCNRSGDWLWSLLAATAAADDALARLIPCISVMRSRGADWPSGISEEERTQWSARVHEYQQQRWSCRAAAAAADQASEHQSEEDEEGQTTKKNVRRKKRCRDLEF